MSHPFIPMPTGGDVLDLILADHALFEDLLRECRRTDRDRAHARWMLAEVLVAHAEAEEKEVYPTVRRKGAITDHDEEHGEEEHAQITEALLAFLDAKGTDTRKYDNALEKLGEVVAHHGTEEELTIINKARSYLSPQVRLDLGAAFAASRNAMLRRGCASRDQVAALLAAAIADAVLPDPSEEESDTE